MQIITAVLTQIRESKSEENTLIMRIMLLSP